MSRQKIQALMTHADHKATEIYLEGGMEALTDADYQTVSAPLSVREIRG